jgi:hypothetical protein
MPKILKKVPKSTLLDFNKLERKKTRVNKCKKKNIRK